MATRLHLLFVVMCLIWGATWIAIRAGVEALPPLLFAGTRLVAAGALLLAWRWLSGAPLTIARAHWPLLGVVALFTMAATYALLFWGMRTVPSGLAAIIHLSLLPVGLYAFGLAHGEERSSARQVAAVGLGLAGLAILFGPAAGATGDPAELRAVAAIVASTLLYGWGSVLSRPLTRRYSPVHIAGWAIFVGGVVLLVLAAAFEPLDRAVLVAFAAPRVLASWLFLVLFGFAGGLDRIPAPAARLGAGAGRHVRLRLAADRGRPRCRGLWRAPGAAPGGGRDPDAGGGVAGLAPGACVAPGGSRRAGIADLRAPGRRPPRGAAAPVIGGCRAAAIARGVRPRCQRGAARRDSSLSGIAGSAATV
ncbi:MAG: DMT family transporter [Alphaproteobacteria bacterium]|nr:DMT family transporter [Alphaproteobacteria bacterium]